MPYSEGATALHEVIELKREVEAQAILLGALRRRLESLEEENNGKRKADTTNA
jgi:hypothetical protein